MTPCRIGLIAGNGRFPLLFSQAAKKKGCEVFAVAHYKETDPSLEKHVRAMDWVYLGQIGKLLKFLKKHHIDQVVMAGGICKTRILSDIRPDLKAITLLTKIRHTHDDNVLRAFADVLEKEGITVCHSTTFLPELLAPEGIWTQREPTESEMSDMILGWRIAKEIGRLDIGQCVVVANGSILAVEAIEGTDAAIRRGAGMAKDAVVVKVCKPTQDTRFDMPAVGEQTLRVMSEVGARVLLVEAKKAVVFDREKMIFLANQNHICIAAWKTLIEF
jgi:DUF1009 family protein